LELQKVRTELLCYEKVIKVSQEEIYQKELLNKAESKAQKDNPGDQLKFQPVKVDWVQVATKNYRKNINCNSNLIQIIPTTASRYESLSNFKDEEASIMSTKEVEIQNSNNYLQTRKRNQLVKRVGLNKQKCTSELRYNLDHRYEVSGFIKSGAKTSGIIKTVEEEVSSLKCNDVVILWGGANDNSSNNTNEAL
jgi:hypothetical protein